MKILFYHYALNMGGIERTIATLSREMSREHEVTFAQFTADEPFYELAPAVKHISFGFSASGNRLVRTVKLYFRIRKLISEERPDVIFCMNKTHLSLFCRAARRCGCPVIGAERSNPHFQMKPRQVRLREQSVRADGFVFQTERARQAYPEKTREKGIVIPNAICNEDVYAGKAELPLLKTFVSVGRLEQVKGYDLLISAFASIADKLPEWGLLIFGKGTKRDELQAQIDKAGLTDRITLAGEDVHAFLRAKNCEIFVLSSRSEGMPNALLEAMACGLAAISFDCENGPRELIEDGVNGILVPPEDEKALAKAMLDLAQDPGRRSRMRTEARKLRDTHSIPAITEEWLKYARERMAEKK